MVATDEDVTRVLGVRMIVIVVMMPMVALCVRNWSRNKNGGCGENGGDDGVFHDVSFFRGYASFDVTTVELFMK
jgi:hypothetical protein